jgi:toxin ParE1/3/4
VSSAAGKPLHLRAAAQLDIAEAIDFSLAESPMAAAGFVDALEAAFTHLQRAPSTGSPRLAHEPNLPGLRSWPLGRHPQIVFYVEHATRLDVWRVLHGSRDLPPWLRQDDLGLGPEPG